MLDWMTVDCPYCGEVFDGNPPREPMTAVATRHENR